jgi:cell division protein FtsW
MRKKYNHADYGLAILVLVLLIVGIIVVASVSASLSQEKFGNPFYFLKHQLLFGIIPGLILGFLAYKINLNLLKKWAPFLLALNLILLAMVFLPGIGTTLGGASRWLAVGPFTFQPSEPLKLTFILYLASWLASRTREEKANKGMKKFSPVNQKSPRDLSHTFIAFLIVLGIVSFLLVNQPDVSTLGIIIVTACIMYFSSGTPFWHSILMFLIGVGALLSLIKISPYRMERWLVFLRPETDPLGIGYQIKQALIAVGSGGISGLGLGMSRQISFLPHSMSDSIFAIFSEETGFAGSLFLIALFLLFLWLGFKIAKSAKEGFAKLLASGITCWIIFQAFINIGAMVAILPLSGVPLPFISYGGSALVTELIGVGILLNISKQT